MLIPLRLLNGCFVACRYVKDVTRYLPLFAKEGTFIFELDNLLTDSLTGQYASEPFYSFIHSHLYQHFKPGRCLQSLKTLSML